MGDFDENNIVPGKRKRKAVDYTKLNNGEDPSLPSLPSLSSLNLDDIKVSADTWRGKSYNNEPTDCPDKMGPIPVSHIADKPPSPPPTSSSNSSSHSSSHSSPSLTPSLLPPELSNNMTLLAVVFVNYYIQEFLLDNDNNSYCDPYHPPAHSGGFMNSPSHNMPIVIASLVKFFGMFPLSPFALVKDEAGIVTRMACRDRCVQIFGTVCAAAIAAKSQTDPVSCFLLATQGRGLDHFAIPGTVFSVSELLYAMIKEKLVETGYKGKGVSDLSEALKSLFSKLKDLAGEGEVIYVPRPPRSVNNMPAGYDEGRKVSHAIGYVAGVLPKGNLLVVIYLQVENLIIVMCLTRKDIFPLYRAADKHVLDYMNFTTSIYYATISYLDPPQRVLQIQQGCRSEMTDKDLLTTFMSYVPPDLVAFLLLFISRGTVTLGGGAGWPWWWSDWWWIWLHEGKIYSLGPAFSQFNLLPQLRLREGGSGLDAWHWMGGKQGKGVEVTEDMLECALRFDDEGLWEMTGRAVNWAGWGRCLKCDKHSDTVKVRVRVILEMWARAELLSNLLSSVAPK
ncbi:hypothetical protein TrCOL_g4829 [Triparma columacea]|uniref:Uncharacterized protein n=1 Tax=Triparma columacea TaxID=722753 RepID=A0A9W7LFN9_9STRA|nr:hypothetical protein TrCOL_g4829 [Triparma columacea]